MASSRARPDEVDIERSSDVDRAALVRAALRSLVAANGLHGTPMSAVAARAGVATGTAYVHYSSKDELVIAAYREAKLQLGQAAVARVDLDAEPAARFEQLWLGVHEYLAESPGRARFLTQIESSPYARLYHETFDQTGDPLTDVARHPDLADRLLPLPLEVLFDLGLAPAVRLVSAGVDLDAESLRTVARACWRAVSAPGPAPRSIVTGEPDEESGHDR